MKGNVNDYNSRGGGISPKRWRLPQAGAEFPESVSHSTAPPRGDTGHSPVGQVGCWAFWFWSNWQQRELGLDTRKDFLSVLVPQPLAPAVGGGRSRREEGGQSAGLEGPREAGGLGKDPLLSDSSSRPCKELKPSF